MSTGHDNETNGEEAVGGGAQGPNPPMPMFPTGDDRMMLTAQERRFAGLIKAAVRDIPEIEPLSDFMYAQYAIVALLQGEPSAQAILERIQNLQCVKEEYQVLNTLEDGKQMISRSLDLVPGFQLAFCYCAEDNTYIWVIDITKFNAAVLTNQEKLRIWMASMYYVHHAFFPDFAAVRRGVMQLIECQGYDWKNANMVNIGVLRKVSEVMANYPLHFCAFKHYHSGMLVNLAVATCRKLLPNKLTRPFEFGCRFEMGRLDEVFLLPTPEVAKQRLAAALHRALEIKYSNEASFSLD